LPTTADRPNRHELIRRHNESLVLHHVGQATVPVSRVVLAELTGLSRPTVNLLVDDLCESGLLREAGLRTGALGRPASLVEVNPRYGVVAAIAVDPTGIATMVCDLVGEVLAETRIPLPRRGPLVPAVASEIGRALTAAGVTDGTVLSYCISEPGVSAGQGLPRSLAPNVPVLDDAALAQLLASRDGSPVHFENDVNLAAIGEQRFGAAQGEPSFAFLLVDAGVGMGLMVKGELLRGTHGAAGEAGYLPIGEGPFTGRAARVGALETAAGRAGFLSHFRRLSGVKRVSLETVWERAASADAAALRAIQDEAELISRAVLATVALLDPAFVVLGGAIGAHPEIVARVQGRIGVIAPYATQVRASALGDRAPLLGAAATALDIARQTLGLPVDVPPPVG
jgi:predicted NBD/HSP70 family sugar kinase